MYLLKYDKRKQQSIHATTKTDNHVAHNFHFHLNIVQNSNNFDDEITSVFSTKKMPKHINLAVDIP